MSVNKKYFISIVVIGYNTEKTLLLLLASLNKQILLNKKLIEIIYVDDGSTDNSVKCFNSAYTKFDKKNILLKQNCGRVAATQAGINAASGQWLYFTRSNIILQPDVLFFFVKSIDAYAECVAFVGSIQYESNDVLFENYLNHYKRGVNKYLNHDQIHYKYLLFGNCIVHSKVFKEFQLNQKLRYYGGEEIDLAEKIFLHYNKQILACKKAQVIRLGHLGFLKHCMRLKEFGQHNIKYLTTSNQKNILGLVFYFKKMKVLSFGWRSLFFVSKNLYKIKLVPLKYWIIRIGLLSSIMQGLLKSK
jgi:glycosyltransferase involved in cell wall biosynthesis